MALMSMALINRGVPARSYTGGQARIQTCDQYKKARIQAIDTQPILDDLEKNRVVVIAGFQGVDKEGNITTLGRGGSDTTAVAIAAALKADECQIYTDVEGVYTTDPRVVPDAKRLEQISFEEMLELSSLGAKVLQIRAVEFAGKYNVPLRVLSSLQEGPGTLITYPQIPDMEAPLVTGITFTRNEAKITLSGIADEHGIASRILAEMRKINCNIDMMIYNKSSFTFTVHSDEYDPTMKHLQELLEVFGAERFTGVTNLAKLSLVGSGLRSHPEVVSKLFESLAEQNVNIHLITTSEIKISVLIEAHLLDSALCSLHNTFCLDNKEVDKLSPYTNIPPKPLLGGELFSK